MLAYSASQSDNTAKPSTLIRGVPLPGRVFSLLLAVCLTVLPASAQQQADTPESTQASPSLPSAPVRAPEQTAATHRFWDKRNVQLFSAVVVARGLDYSSTRNMLARGREEILLPDDVVYSTGGFVALEAAGAATSIGLSYLLHRTGHHKLERWLSIGHASVATFGAGRNYALKTLPRHN
jgi:hypothetical protein